MNINEIKEIIDGGESSKVEFKRKVTDARKIAKEISALANTRGGTILIGVDDDGTIYGVASEKSEIQIVQEACQFHIQPPIVPEVEVVFLYGQYIVIINIKQSHQKPHTMEFINQEQRKAYKRAYIRLGEKSVIASREMYRLMNYQNPDSESIKLSIGEKEKRLFNYLEKYEKATVKDFAKLVNISVRRAERLMIRLVRAGVLQIHNDTSQDYFTLV